MADGKADGNPPRRPAAYVPQFSASTALILRRIRSTSTGTGTGTGLETKPCAPSARSSSSSSSSSGGRRSSLRKDRPPAEDDCQAAASSVQDALLAAAAASASSSSSLKRKRGSRSDAVPDFTQNTMPCPPGMLSSVSAASASARGRPLAVPKEGLVVPRRRSGGSSVGDHSVGPDRSGLGGFHAGEASDVARTRYFMQKSRTHLLDVLSFCDQLHPQLLVDVMVSVSKKHPDLPMFDSPDWQKSLHDAHAAPSSRNEPLIKTEPRPTEPPRPTTTTTTTTGTAARHGHTAVNTKARQRQRNSKTAVRRLVLAQNEEEAPLLPPPPPPEEEEQQQQGQEKEQEEEAENEEEKEKKEEAEKESLPPSWPKAGEGLYSKLPPETEDRAILIDDDDGESFSQFMVDKAGKPIVVSVLAVAVKGGQERLDQAADEAQQAVDKVRNNVPGRANHQDDLGEDAEADPAPRRPLSQSKEGFLPFELS
ncbi:hypothetical protein E4U41_005582 [Claviceps citrina]|nr:hypothetical protein E4U41_005582 [Claviceps citrina]